MGVYYSEDGRYCTSTLDVEPKTTLTLKGEKDTAAAIIIQRWWKNIINKRLQQFHSDMTSTTSEDTQNSLEVHGSLRKRFKKKLNEVDSECDIDTDYSDTELIDYESTQETEDTEEYDEYELQTINDNNFLWGFVMSFLAFFKSLFGY